MSFKLSSKIHPEKIFLVKKSEIEGRLDPHFYKPEYKSLAAKLKANRCKTLGETIRFSHETWNQKAIFEEKFPYIEIGEIELSTGEIKKISWLSKKEAPSRAKMVVRPNDIIVSTTRPSRGAISLVDNRLDCQIASTGFAIIRDIRLSEIQRKFLFHILRQKFTLKQMEQRSSGGNYPAITFDELKKIIIPIVMQNIIVSKMESAYAAKKKKETEAQKLLNSINDYLLGELGITLPKEKNTIRDRIFYRNFSDVSGNRFDPKRYDANTINLRNAIKSSPYKKVFLKNLVIQTISGEWGLDENFVDTDKSYQKCLVIRATEFDNKYNLNTENNRVKYRQIKKNKLKKLDIQESDLLIEKSGGSPVQPVGRVALITKDLLKKHNICFSNFILKIRVNDRIIPEYLFEYLKTVHNIKLTDSMQSQTSGIRNLIMQEYFYQDIILPTKEKQRRLAERIGDIRNKAKHLCQKAIMELETAKQEVEAMILGS